MLSGEAAFSFWENEERTELRTPECLRLPEAAILDDSS